MFYLFMNIHFNCDHDRCYLRGGSSEFFNYTKKLIKSHVTIVTYIFFYVENDYTGKTNILFKDV